MRSNRRPVSVCGCMPRLCCGAKGRAGSKQDALRSARGDSARLAGRARRPHGGGAIRLRGPSPERMTEPGSRGRRASRPGADRSGRAIIPPRRILPVHLAGASPRPGPMNIAATACGDRRTPWPRRQPTRQPQRRARMNDTGGTPVGEFPVIFGERRSRPRREKAAMARLTGLEPATPGVTGRYSNQLSYNRAIIRQTLPSCAFIKAQQIGQALLNNF